MKKLLLFPLLLLLIFNAVAQAPKIIYVNAAASGAGNGTSWIDAYVDFQAGINSAASGDSVFVAKGNYQPAISGAYFSMKEGVKIYGSFAGTETSLNGRNLPANLKAGDSSVLKGHDNRVIDNETNNLTAAAVLDGFSISNGNVNSGKGGGMYNNNASPTITNCTFVGNASSSNGGGMYNYNASPTITNCTFMGNTSDYGGGMYNSQSSPTITNSTFAMNTAVDGGGIGNNHSSPTLINCVFSGNTTNNHGGGMYNSDISSPILTNCIFVGNKATVYSGGGIDNNSSSPNLTNTIFWGNTAPSGADIFQNLGSFTINYSYTQTAQSGNNNITGNIDPFVNSSNPAGADGVYGTADDGLHLASGSAAINAGTPDISGLNLPSMDIAGLPRIVRGRIDIGAFEQQTTIYVNSANTSGTYNGLTWATAYNFLQTAINNAVSGDSVFVAGGNYPLVAGYTYVMKEGAKIYGSFAGTENSLSQRNLAAGNISVLKGSDGRVIDNSTNNLSATSVLDGFSITGGTASYGAGMYNYASSPTISNCTFWGNTASEYGGGMENSSASPVLINCIFSGNSVTGGVGGGIYNYASTATMTNCTFFGNTASGNGGGIYNSSSSPVLTNTIFWGNTAASGADIFQDANSFTLNYSYTQTDFTSGRTGNITGEIDPFVNSGIPAGPDGIFGTADDGLHLANGSAAINTGITDISGLNLPVTDITGLPRTARSRIDMGAYEFNTAATWHVIENATGNGGSWLNASGDFQGTINGAYSGDSVFVAGGTYQPATSGGSFSMKAGIKIYGGFEGTESGLSQRNLAAGGSSILKGNGASVVRNANNGLDGSAILDGFTITQGDANGGFPYSMGGGVYNDNGTPILSNLIIENNSASDYGGGLYVLNSSPTLFNVVFSNNSAVQGGGIYNAQGASVYVTNSTFWKNSAPSGGGALYNYSSLAPVLSGVIIWGNELSPGVDAPSASIYYAYGHPLVSNSLIAHSGGSSGWYYAMGDDGGGNLDVDPKFMNAAAGDFRLKITSQAINGGSNNLPIWDTVALGGNPRIFDKAGGGLADMGAYEYEGYPIRPDVNGILYVNSAAASGGDGDSWETALQSFGNAIRGGVIINATASLPVDSLRQIWVAKGTYLPDTAGHSFFMLPKVKIYGSFNGTEALLANRILTTVPTSILKGNGNTVIRNYYNGLDTTAVLDGFSITGGYNTNTEVTQGGGGISSYGVSPTMSHLLITANEAFNGSAILNDHAAPEFANVVVTANTCTSGTIYNSSSGSFSPTFTNVIISNNTAGFASGMFNGLSSPLLTNVLISGNSATQFQGGGLMNLLAHPVLTNVTITGNSAANSGGGIYNFSGSSTELINSIVWGNTAPTGNEIVNDGATITIHHSLYGNGTNDLVELNGGTTTIDANSITTDPKFVDAANGNYQLQQFSPAINAGDNSSIAVWDTTDLAGNVRIYGKATGGIVDMGAYESQNFALPVKMSKLTGSVGKEQHAILSWSTFSEIQNKGFQIEYSLDGIHFKDGQFVLSKVQGGNSVSTLHYNVDGGALFSATYFRVKQVSLDGTALRSNVVYLPVENHIFGITAFPNPVHNLLNVHIEDETSPRGQLMIMDMAGRILKRISITDVDAKIDVSGLAAGIYMLQYTGEKHNATIKLIKK